MKEREVVYIKRRKVYDEDKIIYQKGIIERIYSNHILVRIECENGNVFRESFFESELEKERELKSNEYIY